MFQIAIYYVLRVGYFCPGEVVNARRAADDGISQGLQKHSTLESHV